MLLETGCEQQRRDDDAPADLTWPTESADTGRGPVIIDPGCSSNVNLLPGSRRFSVLILQAVVTEARASYGAVSDP